MSDGIQLIIKEGGVAEIYDDTYDLTIHCTSADEQREILRKINEAFNPEKKPSCDQEAELQSKIKVGAFYRHFKGCLYLVTGIARNTETLETLVIYKDKHGKLGAIPIAMFCGMAGDVPRFTEVDNGRLDL